MELHDALDHEALVQGSELHEALDQEAELHEACEAASLDRSPSPPFEGGDRWAEHRCSAVAKVRL